MSFDSFNQINYCPFRGFCDDEATKSCVCVRKNSEFYRGALALETFPVSEVNIAPRIQPDFGKISHCEGGSLFKRFPKKSTFCPKMSANCR